MFKDWIEIRLKSADGKPKPDEKYKITFADGTERDGNLDGEGVARIEDIPPGPYRVDFPDNPAFSRKEGR